MMQAKK